MGIQASGSFDRTIRLWECSSLRTLKEFKGHNAFVNCLAFSPDGRRLASGGNDCNVRLWDVTSGGEVKKLKGHTSRVNCLHFTSDGLWLASCSNDRTVKIWDAQQLKEAFVFQGHTDRIRCLAFSPDKKTVATGSDDQTIRVWNIYSKTGFAITPEFGSSVTCLTFSADGKWMASGCDDCTVKLWDTSSWALQKTMNIVGKITSVSFDLHGHLAISSNKGAISIFQRHPQTNNWFLKWSTHRMLPTASKAHLDEVNALSQQNKRLLMQRGVHIESKPQTGLLKIITDGMDRKIVNDRASEAVVKIQNITKEIEALFNPLAPKAKDAFIQELQSLALLLESLRNPDIKFPQVQETAKKIADKVHSFYNFVIETSETNHLDKEILLIAIKDLEELLVDSTSPDYYQIIRKSPELSHEKEITKPLAIPLGNTSTGEIPSKLAGSTTKTTLKPGPETVVLSTYDYVYGSGSTPNRRITFVRSNPNEPLVAEVTNLLSKSIITRIPAKEIRVEVESTSTKVEAFIAGRYIKPDQRLSSLSISEQNSLLETVNRGGPRKVEVTDDPPTQLRIYDPR